MNRIGMSHSEAGKLGQLKSKITQEKQKQKRIDEYNKHPKICECCGTPIPYEKRNNRFCSHRCSAEYNNKLRSGEKVLCENCGKEIKSKDKSRRKFCSSKCQQESQYKTYIKKWKSGEENGMKGEYGISNHIVRYLKEKYNNSCQICHWCEINPHTHKVPLEVHHIDGNYLNNKEENLQLLCPNCHSLTETYKAANKSGRKGRNKYS